MTKNPSFSLLSQENNHLEFIADEKHLVHVFILEEDLIRIMLLPEGKISFPKTWAIAPGQEDVATEGRDRRMFPVFPCLPILLRKQQLRSRY